MFVPLFIVSGMRHNTVHISSTEHYYMKKYFTGICSQKSDRIVLIAISSNLILSCLIILIFIFLWCIVAVTLSISFTVYIPRVLADRTYAVASKSFEFRAVSPFQRLNCWSSQILLIFIWNLLCLFAVLILIFFINRKDFFLKMKIFLPCLWVLGLYTLSSSLLYWHT